MVYGILLNFGKSFGEISVTRMPRPAEKCALRPRSNHLFRRGPIRRSSMSCSAAPKITLRLIIRKRTTYPLGLTSMVDWNLGINQGPAQRRGALVHDETGVQTYRVSAARVGQKALGAFLRASVHSAFIALFAVRLPPKCKAVTAIHQSPRRSANRNAGTLLEPSQQGHWDVAKQELVQTKW
jgi:hypothetical protein